MENKSLPICGVPHNRFSTGITKRSQDYAEHFKKSLQYEWYDVLPYSCGLWAAIYAECASSGKWAASRENSGNMCIEYIIDGSLEIIANKQTYSMTQGDLFMTITGTGNIFRDHNDSPCRHIQIVIMGGMARLIPEMLGISNHPIYHLKDDPRRHQEFLHIASRLKEINREKNIAFARENTELTYRLMLILSEIRWQHEDQELPNILANAVNMMKNLNNHLKSVTQVADILMVSRATLTRLFQKYFNTSPGTFWNNLKIETAKNLLNEEGISIKEISEKLNFDNPFYFSTVFKRQTGLSPRDFRKQLKSEEREDNNKQL